MALSRSTIASSNNPVVGKLRAAKSLINTPAKWFQGGFGHVFRVDGGEPMYDKLCMYGAVSMACRSDSYRVTFMERAWSFLTRVVGGPPSLWNDDPKRTHAEVMEAFDKAIALAEAEA